MCSQAVSPEPLRRQLRERLAAMAQYDATAKQLTAARDTLNAAGKLLEHRQQAYLTAVQILCKDLQESPFPEVTQRAIDFPRFAALAVAEKPFDPALTALADALIREAGGLDLQLAAQKNRVQKDLHQLNANREHYWNITEGVQRARELEVVLQGLQHALQLVRNARIMYTQGVLDEVGEECNRLYRLLHPQEPLGTLRLSMDLNRRGSLLQHAGFAGHADIPPQAYYSDAHLDTLGFCLFLAIAKHPGDGNSIVVFDDIFTSADTAHLTRIMDLLDAETAHFAQMIVTTHHRDWQDRFSSGKVTSDTVQLLCLRPWSPAAGLRIENVKTCAG